MRTALYALALLGCLLLAACDPLEILSTAVPANEPLLPTAALAPAAASPTTAAPAGPVALQGCTLVTTADAEAILGEPAGPGQESGGGCAYNNASDSLYAVSAGAAQGQETEQILQALVFVLGMAGAPLDEPRMERFRSLAAAQDYPGFFAEMVAAAEGVPTLHSEIVDGLGDTAYWLWIDAGERRQGALAVARGQTLVNVNLVVPGDRQEPAMRDAAAALALALFDRLPEHFTTLPSEPSSTTPPTAGSSEAPPPGFAEQPSYAGDCLTRPAGTVCLGFEDGYIWFISPWEDSVLAWGEAGTWHGSKIQVIFGEKADYHHIVGTNLVKQVGK